MPKKYHIDTKKIPPRLPKTGKFGIVDWREDCARCHNCVKKACVYDRYRQEMQYIKNLDEFSAMFCALNGATRKPSCLKMRHSAATSKLLPTDDIVPWIIRTELDIESS